MNRGLLLRGKMRKLGVHLSIAGGVYKSLEKADKMGINTVQIFLKNNNRWQGKEFSKKEIDEFKNLRSSFSEINIFAHSGYLINLAGDGENLDKSIDTLKNEINRAHILDIEYIVIHPGSHKGRGVETGIKSIAENVDYIFKDDQTNVKLLLETTAGQGTSIGHRFEHLQKIIDHSSFPERLGVCIDTCHIFSAGYDFTTEESLDKTLFQFNEILGFDRLKLIHLNDSKKGLGSFVDRHEHIGDGEIGIDGFSLLLNDKRIDDVPIVLETPKFDDDQADIMNLKKVRDII